MKNTIISNAFFGRLMLLVLGFGLGAVLAEIGARAFFPPPVPVKSPFLRYQADSQCGYRFRPSQTGYELSSLATINRWGFRGSDWQVDRAPEVVRIALLGDSMVFGPGVNDDETFGALLERRLNAQATAGRRYEVLNFGVPGYDTGHELQVLKHYAIKFKPDLVLLNFYLNDLIVARNYARYPELFRQQEKELSTWKWRLRELPRKSRLAMTLWDVWQAKSDNPMTRLINAYIYHGVVPPNGPGEDGWHFVEDNLRLLRDLSLLHEFGTGLVILPLAQEVVDDMTHAPYQDFLTELSHKLGIIPIQVLPDLRSSGRGPWELYIPYNNHFAEGAHQIISKTLARTVENMLDSKIRRKE